DGLPGHNGTDGIPGPSGPPGADGKRGKRGEHSTGLYVFLKASGNNDHLSEKAPVEHNSLREKSKLGANKYKTKQHSHLKQHFSFLFCLIKSLINPRGVAKMENTFGAWMKDTAQLNDERIWVAEHFSGQRRHFILYSFYQGCGHAVHNGSFYYHIAGTPSIGRTCFLTYFKLAADENGLWLIFASSADESIMVAQLNEKTFSITSLINTTYPRSKAGNAFIACGVLYVTDNNDSRVTFAFDLLKRKAVNVTFDLRSTSGVLAMLSYSPQDRLLYVWDESQVRLFVVHFISDE
uniref:Gliomedin n=1 Tax=Oryzias latipes TaxID=8090 RepID=A0A3P9LHT1_ORYLA